MLVHVISRPITGDWSIARGGLEALAEGLRIGGATVLVDAREAPGGGSGAAVVDCTAGHLREVWARTQPDVVHAFGHLAALAAVHARGRAPVVATFDEWPADASIEADVAALVDCVLPLSRAEHRRWRRSGAIVPSGTLSLATDIPDPEACAQPSGDVICLSDDASLDTLIASMPHWAPNRLVLVARLSARRRAEVCAVADRVGVRNRIVYRPAPRGPVRDLIWARAALAFSGPAGSRHGSDVIEAASRGIPSIAVAAHAHLDQVIPGVTGLLVEPADDARTLGRAIASVLSDPFHLRGLGAAALVRARAMHAPPHAGARLLLLLDELQHAVANRVQGPQPATAAASRDPRGAEEGNAWRSALVVDHLHLAHSLAGRYTGHGQSADDLHQVACLGLVLAAERFDPARGTAFASFAIPTILGELRRYFRDNAWAVQVPRGVQEAALEVQWARDELRQSLGHDPNSADLARRLGRLEEDVRRTIHVVGEARSSRSLDHATSDDGSFLDSVGELDPALDLAELRADVRAALLRLPAQEQRILLLRYYGERTQAEIAADLGVSQVHVSRLLNRILVALHDHVLHDAPLPRQWVAPAPLIPAPRQGSAASGARTGHGERSRSAAAQPA